MAVILGIAARVLAGISLVAGVFFVFRAIRDRAQSARAPYDVGRQEARLAMYTDLARGGAAFFVGLILFAIVSLVSAPAQITGVEGGEPTEVATETAVPLITTVVISPTNTPFILPTNTPQLPTATTLPPTPTIVPTDTPPPAPPTATVSSGVGVWLRSAPGTSAQQLEWLLDGTVVTLLPGRETADEFEWQQVRAPSGQEGWVAAEFLVVNQP
ncbi:MAG: SH3 domain-containing protein [Chloroflexi bacterium]|nr:MAG: SH3 domain-containing protein [Chloroflexota bacterium]